MRWEHLFEDMESQLAAAQAQARSDEVAELTRAERASVALADRLRSAVAPGQGPLVVTTRSGEVVKGAVTDVGPAWVLVEDSAREHLVPLSAVARVSGLPDLAAPTLGPALRRLGVGHVLRAVARDRSIVRLALGGAGALQGRIDAVGSDHLDLTVAYPDSGRPTGERHTVLLVALEVVTRL